MVKGGGELLIFKEFLGVFFVLGKFKINFGVNT